MVLLLLLEWSLPTIRKRPEEPGRVAKNDARLLVQTSPRAGRLFFSYLVSLRAMFTKVCRRRRRAQEVGPPLERI